MKRKQGNWWVIRCFIIKGRNPCTQKKININYKLKNAEYSRYSPKTRMCDNDFTMYNQYTD